MAKKYLLYIHNPKFDLENEKSNLVNLLLDRHYDFYKPGTMVETVSDESIVGNAELAEILKKPVKTYAEKDSSPMPDLSKVVNDKVYTFCAHGYAPKLCKKAKPGKPCKV